MFKTELVKVFVFITEKSVGMTENFSVLLGKLLE